ncbi:MAG: hypothetical protein JXQ95_12050 [Alteromonas stellipolaris]|uniref:hypothetical protein n=1 Tax=Alteromonas stellipolaris TaxID=233316 RepID=UPI003B8DF6F6
MDNDFNQEHREIEKDLWELEKRQSTRRKFEAILKIYSLFGLLIAIFGIAYFVFTIIEIELSKSQQLALLVSGTGVALSITSWAFLVMRREKLNEDVEKLKAMQDLGEFVWKWSKFEEISKKVLLSEGSEFNRYSIREVIEQLYARKLIDKEDAISLEEAIQARNMAVHGGGSIPKKMLEHYSLKIDEIISKVMKKPSN